MDRELKKASLQALSKNKGKCLLFDRHEMYSLSSADFSDMFLKAFVDFWDLNAEHFEFKTKVPLFLEKHSHSK